MTEPTPDFTGDNGGPKVDPAFEAVVAKIDDLYLEASNFADGEPIASAEIAEAVTALFDGLGAAGREAEALRVAEVKPLDEAKTVIQQKYHPLIGDTKVGKGKTVRGRAVLQTLLTTWRTEQARLARVAADKAREEAEALAAEAQAAMAASAGNLEAREEAENLVGFAKEASKFARGKEKSATVGTGLRTVWTAELVDESLALEWAYGRDPGRFKELVQQMADEAVRSNTRSIPGFKVLEGKKAA